MHFSLASPSAMATTSVYESARMTHEEIEQYEDALVDTLNNPPKASSHRLMLQWQLAASALLDQMVSRFATLDTMYADATQERVQEWEALGRQDEDPFSEFDARLAELQSFYRRYPERAITLQTTATPSVLGTHDVSLFDLSAIEREFSGEEMGGRFLDLYVHYESYINLRGAPRLSYLEYIARLDTAAASVPPTTKRTETYHAYSQALVQYLSAFLHKTRPLEDMDTVEARALASFDSDWEHGVVPGWEAREAVLYGEHRAPGEGIWCGACQRSYAKQTVYDAHLTSARHQKAAARVQAAPESAPDREAAARASELEHAKKVMRAKLVARDEVLIQALAHELATVREETRTNVERKAALTEREREEEAEALEAELDEAVATGGLGYEDAPERGTPGGGDKMYNPLKLPMGWDGKPIPFWMYKLHGLRVEYKCEICSDHVYKGRKVFEKHFGESRHAFGMRALGLPNTAPFRGVTRIQEAFALAEKLKQQSRANYVDEDDTVEVEDEHGNVRSARGCTDTGIYPQDVRATQAPGSFVVYSAVAVFLPACPAARHAVCPPPRVTCMGARHRQTLRRLAPRSRRSNGRPTGKADRAG